MTTAPRDGKIVGMTNVDTATTIGARMHARAQAGASADAMPVRPASNWSPPPDGVSPDALTWAETVDGGGHASKVLARGTTIRLTDTVGDACAHLLLYNADQLCERLNAADTLKIPWQAYLGTGHPLLSDQGRLLAVITADSSHRHDALCGAGPEGRERFIRIGAKHGLEPRDLPPSVSFFQHVHVEPSGDLRFDGASGPAHVELRCELPVLLLLANVAHPARPADRPPPNDARDPGHGAASRPVLTIPCGAPLPNSSVPTRNTADYAASTG